MTYKVLVVDDKALNRAALTMLLEADGTATVVGRASDGQEAVRLVHETRPDVVTLDLEMPRMDGFTFLRILQSVRPTPVIVVSTDSRPHSVFQALELGALDFVVKPGIGDLVPDSAMGRELRSKVVAAAQYATRMLTSETAPERESTGFRRATIGCVALAASTGGPPVVQQFLDAFSLPPPFSILVAQHMPPRFTEALAERLRKRVKMPVSELRQAEPILRGRAYILPGGLITTVKNVMGHVVARVASAAPETLTPNADALLGSVAEAYGAEAVAVVLTGMGRDGCEGARLVEKAGGRVFVESPAGAVLPTMPQATLDMCATARPMQRDALCRYFVNAAQVLARSRPLPS